MHLLRTKSGVPPSRGTSDWRRYGASAAQIRLDYDSLRMNPFQPVIYPVYGNLAYFPSFFYPLCHSFDDSEMAFS